MAVGAMGMGAMGMGAMGMPAMVAVIVLAVVMLIIIVMVMAVGVIMPIMVVMVAHECLRLSRRSRGYRGHIMQRDLQRNFSLRFSRKSNKARFRMGRASAVPAAGITAERVNVPAASEWAPTARHLNARFAAAPHAARPQVGAKRFLLAVARTMGQSVTTWRGPDRGSGFDRSHPLPQTSGLPFRNVRQRMWGQTIGVQRHRTHIAPTLAGNTR
jgi:hypothetical protein